MRGLISVVLAVLRVDVPVRALPANFLLAFRRILAFAVLFTS